MPLIGWLLSIAGSLAVRVLISLGIGIISYAGLSTMVTSFSNDIQANYNSLPAATLQLANLGGMGDFLSIVTAAFVTRASLAVLKRFALK